jgi:hypothetical protein
LFGNENPAATPTTWTIRPPESEDVKAAEGVIYSLKGWVRGGDPG